MSTFELTPEVLAVFGASSRALSRPSTVVEEWVRDLRYERSCGRNLAVDLSASDLVKHVAETWQGPADDMASYLADGMDDMPLEQRPQLNELLVKLAIGTITVDEQSKLNEILRERMIAHGSHLVGCEVARALDGAR